MSNVIAKLGKWALCVAITLGNSVIWPAQAATITAGGAALSQQTGSSACSYSQASESVQGDWTFTCGTGSATLTISPAVNGTVCQAYGAMYEDLSGNWTVTGCVSAAPTVSLDSPAQSGSTYTANVPFTLKATASAPAGRTISSVEFFHDGVSIHAGVPSGSQFTWDWAPPTGTYEVTVRATDVTGAVTETSPAAQMIFAAATGAATIYYIHPDQLGTPREITRASDNQIVWRWDNTEAFGDTQPNENPSGLGAFTYNLRFPGQYYDFEASTNYNYFRDYDPSIGRYIESDPIGLKAGWNTFGYANQDPLSYVDENGQFAFLIIPGICAAGGCEAILGGAALWCIYNQSSGKDTLKPGPFAGDSIPARGPGRRFNPGERDATNQAGRDKGCHTCGNKDPGTKSGNFVPDHQPPSGLNNGGDQRLYPQCIDCSRVQGGQVRGQQGRGNGGNQQGDQQGGNGTNGPERR